MKFNIVGKDASILPRLNICDCDVCRAPWPEGAPSRWEEEWAAHIENVRSSATALDAAIDSAINGGHQTSAPWVEDPDLPPIDLTPRYRKDTPLVPKGTQTVIYSSDAPAGWRVVSVDGSKLVIERE